MLSPTGKGEERADQLRAPGQVIVDTNGQADPALVNSIVADVIENTDDLALTIDQGAIIPR